MRNWLIISLISMFILLAGCSAKQNVDIETTKPLYFSKNKEMPFEIKVTEDRKVVKGLKISAELSMVDMDHGTTEVAFDEGKDGIYASKVELPMEGDWEVVYTIDRDGKTFEKVIQYKVEESPGVAMINGKLITSEDIEFYRFINTLHIAISRKVDEAKYTGKELENSLAYWDTQEKANENQNQLLTQIIRLRAMALLGEEKGHKATAEEVDSALKTVREQYDGHEIAKNMIKEFGEEKFWDIEKRQYEMIVLSQKVQQDLIADVKKKNPKVNDQEISYLAQKVYEELLVSQVNSLDIEIF
ncbi:FixH family protein [Bacillus sp. CGMCC 1.16607]|uniref:FixH family protein n=1 Tax=Bacillus sp. CGMCC 1.16607 TaxID=3351842 RepID=UPI0036342078